MAYVFRLTFILGYLILSHTSHAQDTPLTIGAYHYPPFMDETQNNGLYIQLGQAIETISDIKFKWVFYPYARVDRFFSLGKVDMEIGSSPSWSQDKLIPGLFTHVFYQLEDVAIYHERSNQYAPNQDIKGKSIGIVRGYSFPQFQQVFEQKLAYKTEGANERQLLKLLLNDRIDQVFMSKLVFLHLQKNEPKYKALRIGEVVGRYDVAIRVHPNNAAIIPTLNQAIDQLKQDGTINSLFTSEPTSTKKPAEAGL